MVRETKVTTDFGEVSVTVRDDGDILVQGLHSFYEMGVPAPLAIWKMYQNYHLGDRVVRSGHGLCGVYPFDPAQPLELNYAENDTMHSTSVEELAWNVFRYYPSLFSIEEQVRIISFIRYHDLGEAKNGDKPDDGSTKREDKVRTELNEFIKQIQYLPPYLQEDLIGDFLRFENATWEMWRDEDKKVMQFAKVCDKIDAPLSALLYEQQGRVGTLDFKQQRFGDVTAQDQHYIDLIGESSCAAVWTAHILDEYREFWALEMLLRVVIAAVKDVRGEVFPWLKDYLKKQEIFDDSTIRCLLG